MKNNSLVEALFEKTCGLFRKYAVPFLSALVMGLFAHGYAFTNKLLNADETAALFSKGADITSGRWGLTVSGYIFPDASMPWIYGVISLLLLSAAACITVRIFRIKSVLLQGLLAGAITVFPAQTGTFCFMYTSAPYALAVLLTVLSVYLCTEGKLWKYIAACLLLAFALLIYQAYISIAASYFVILLILRTADGEEKITDILKSAARYFSLLLAALVVYLAATYIVKLVGGNEYQEYEVFAEGSIPRRIMTAYSSFVRMIFKSGFGFVPSGLSMAAHIVCGAAAVLVIVCACAKKKDTKKLVLLLALLAVYPLSVNCLYLIASVNIIHSVSQFGFVSVYVITAAAADRLMRGRALMAKDAVIAALTLIIAGNVFFANEIYLKMYLEYENAYAFYNTLTAQAMDMPLYSRFTVLDIVGNEHRGEFSPDRIDTKGLVGPNENLIDIYTRCDFILNYLGQNQYMYREDIIWADWFYDMPVYPDPGSIMMPEGDDRVIIKLS